MLHPLRGKESNGAAGPVSHQAQVRQAVERILADKGRAAVILPAAQGKDTLPSALLSSIRKPFSCGCPRRSVFFCAQTERFLRANLELSLENVAFCTCASPIYRTSEERIARPCDSIILDEFCRCGSEHWGAVVQQRLNSPRVSIIRVCPVRGAGGIARNRYSRERNGRYLKALRRFCMRSTQPVNEEQIRSRNA